MVDEIESWGEHFNWTCDVCGADDFNKDEAWFVGHRWDCLEPYYYEEYEDEEE